MSNKNTNKKINNKVIKIDFAGKAKVKGNGKGNGKGKGKVKDKISNPIIFNEELFENLTAEAKLIHTIWDSKIYKHYKALMAIRAWNKVCDSENFTDAEKEVICGLALDYAERVGYVRFDENSGKIGEYVRIRDGKPSDEL